MRGQPPVAVPAYISTIVELLEAYVPLRPGTALMAVIAHDATCPMAANPYAGSCMCDPEVSLVDVPAPAGRSQWN